MLRNKLKLKAEIEHMTKCIHGKVYWQQSSVFYKGRVHYLILNKYEEVKHDPD